MPSFVKLILSIYESKYISSAQSYVWVFKDVTDSNGNEGCHPDPIIKDNMYSKTAKEHLKFECSIGIISDKTLLSVTSWNIMYTPLNTLYNLYLRTIYRKRVTSNYAN